jgi:Na+/H+ antiporter
VTGLLVIGLVVGALTVTAICRRRGIPSPLVLVVVGIIASFLPGVSDLRFDPNVVLLLVITPLLYSAALDSSYLSIRANLRPIGLLAVGLVIFTAGAVALVAWWLIPGLSFAAALVLGAVVAPPDAVAAVTVGRRLGLPRRVMTILAGESLFNDATALTLFRVAVAAAVGGTVTVLDASLMFIWSVAGGVAVGLVIGVVVHRVRRKLADAQVESALGLVVPFTAYLVAEQVHASGVLAVVVAGLYLGYHAPETGFATRLQDDAVWRASDTVLESVVFTLIGLQLTSVVQGEGDIGHLLYLGTIITAVALVARVVWVFPATYAPRALFRGVRARDPSPRWQIPAVISWAGMRGAITVAAAFAIPAELPHRNALVFVAFFVTVATLLLHGTTLPLMIRRLGVRRTDQQQEVLAEAEALHAAVQAALKRLDELVPQDGPSSEHLTRKLRMFAEMQSNAVWERLGRPDSETGESPTATYRRLRREMLGAERETVVELRNAGRIDDEVLRRILRELDLEEAMLTREDEL